MVCEWVCECVCASVHMIAAKRSSPVHNCIFQWYYAPVRKANHKTCQGSPNQSTSLSLSRARAPEVKMQYIHEETATITRERRIGKEFRGIFHISTTGTWMSIAFCSIQTLKRQGIVCILGSSAGQPFHLFVITKGIFQRLRMQLWENKPTVTECRILSDRQKFPMAFWFNHIENA